MYSIFKLAGIIIRQFFLPNPFTTICPDNASIINLIFGFLLWPIAYAVTGMIYDRHSDEAFVGSLLFNVVYIGISIALWGLLSAIKFISDNWILVASIVGVILLITSVIFILIILNKRKKKHDEEEASNE